MTPRDAMLGVLALGAALLVVSFWRAHRSSLAQFNMFDLIVANGRVDKIALAFMVAFGVTTWIVIYLTVRDKMTEGMFLAYGGMWVAPLVAKVVFDKNEIPSTTSTTLVQQTTEVTKP